MKKTILLAALIVQLAACAKINVFEKDVAIRDQRWLSSFKPAVTFTITDTVASYNLFVVIRHSDAYNYNNLWLNVYTRSPGDSVRKQSLELQLGDNKKGWLGSGMDDIIEQRIQITSAPIKFKKPGDYQFSFEQIMREDPLNHVLDVGLRIEKAL